MKRSIIYYFIGFALLLTDVVWAQTSATVSGVVIDENGETLPGVSVVEVGTTNGVLTDLNGHYTLKQLLPNLPFLSVTLVIRPPRFP